jgi:adenylate cyclase
MITNETSEESREPTAITKRVAVVFADLAGTTALIATVGDLSVAGALQTLFRRSYHLQTAYNGRVLKTFGDGFLAIFEDVANALHFAIALQQSLAHEPLLVGQHMAIRMSIHVGSVVLMETSYGEEVLGDAVNVAAYLERQAQPGQIVVSASACQALPREQQALLGPSELVSLRKRDDQVEFRRMDVGKG